MEHAGTIVSIAAGLIVALIGGILVRSISGYFGRLNTMLMELKMKSHDHGGKEVMLVDDCRNNHDVVSEKIEKFRGDVFKKLEELKETILNVKIDQARAWDGIDRRRDDRSR